MSLLKLKKKETVEGVQEEVAEQPKKEGGRYKLVQVPDTYKVEILDAESNETMDLLQAITEMKNEIDDIKKFLASS